MVMETFERQRPSFPSSQSFMSDATVPARTRLSSEDVAEMKLGALLSLIDAWEAGPQLGGKKKPPNTVDEARAHVLRRGITIDWTWALLTLLRQQESRAVRPGVSPILRTVDMVACRLVREGEMNIPARVIREIAGSGDAENDTSPPAAGVGDSAQVQQRVGSEGQSAEKVQRTFTSAGALIVQDATEGRVREVLQTHGFVDSDYEMSTACEDDDSSSTSSSHSEDWEIASSDSCPEYAGFSGAGTRRRGHARRATYLARPGNPRWPSGEVLHGRAAVGLFGVDYRRDAAVGRFFYVALHDLPLRYYIEGGSMRVDAEPLAKAFAGSIIGEGGNTYLSLPIECGGTPWNRPFAAIDSRGEVRISKDISYVTVSILSSAALPPGLPAADIGLELRLDAPAQSLDHAQWDAARKKAAPEGSDSDDDVVILPGPPPPAAAPARRSEVDEATARAFLQYVDEYNEGEYKNHPVVADIRATAAKHQPAEIARVLEWLHVVTDLLRLEFVVELDNQGSAATTGRAADAPPPPIAVETITPQIVGRYLGRRAAWVEECVRCQRYLDLHHDEARLEEVLSDLQEGSVNVHGMLATLREAFGGDAEAQMDGE
ncbi:hypothetical protein C8Q76DRAFT_803043 [Earliella scabrosa]|nr:hypothetical protein C8Q76DRAFT_803043 [Earliella scabrosa]